jgi:DNA-binding NarL/FixJ family response regulator
MQFTRDGLHQILAEDMADKFDPCHRGLKIDHGSVDNQLISDEYTREWDELHPPKPKNPVSEREKRIIDLRDQGLKFAEIAEMLGSTANSVQTTYLRAKKKRD